MKKLFLLPVMLLTGAVMLQAQTEKEIKPEIKHVTVFPDRAQIDHETSVTLAPGKSVVKLTGLSPYIDPQSVQVKGFGDFTILAVNQQNDYLENLEETPEVKNIQDQIEALQLKVQDENAAISVLKEKASFLSANKALLIKETTISAEQFKNIMDLYTNNMDQVTMTVLKKERLIKEYEKQIGLLQQQISARMNRKELPTGEISVTISTDKQVNGKLTCSYVVTNAGWYPSYDIRVDDIKNPVTILYKANVYQNTGIQWKDVKLSFSNATPWISGDIPVLYPWFIDYYTPPQVTLKRSSKGREMAPAMAEVASESAAKLEEADFMPAAPPEVQKQIGTTTIIFDIAVPYSVPADGKIQTVEIQRLKAPAEYKYVSLPKLAPRAYLSANINDWAQLSLQNGEATLYFENSYVGKSYLNVDQLTDTLMLSLGTDNSILVKREKRKDVTSTRVLGSNRTETFSYLITVRNNKPTPVRITLKDQIPVSSNSGIEVEAIELSKARHNTQTGELIWDLEIKPSETRELVLTYSVKYPKDRKIILE